MMYTLKYINLLVLTLVLVFGGCSDDKCDEPPLSNLDKSRSNTVLIANQGNFGWGEGTLSVYYKSEKLVENDVYQAKNDESVGNVFQSITQIGDEYFFVINNSGKVIVTDSNFVKKTEIKGFTSPRYLYDVGGNKAFVTDLYADAISVVDLSTNEIVDQILIGGSTEKAIIHDGLFWCVSEETDSIYAINVSSRQIWFSDYIGANPKDIIMSSEEDIIVLCAGALESNKAPSLALVIKDPISNSFSQGNRVRMNLPEDAQPSHIIENRTTNQILYLDRGYLRTLLDIALPEAEDVYHFPDGVMYGIKVDPRNGDIYAADAIDFVSKSKIYRLSSSYEVLDEFFAGIITGDFFFPSE